MWHSTIQPVVGSHIKQLWPYFTGVNSCLIAVKAFLLSLPHCWDSLSFFWLCDCITRCIVLHKHFIWMPYAIAITKHNLKTESSLKQKDSTGLLHGVFFFFIVVAKPVYCFLYVCLFILVLTAVVCNQYLAQRGS